MSARHKMATFYRGDEWEISGTLFDAEGKPQVLTGAQIEWALYNYAGVVAANASLSDDITVVAEDTGLIRIVVPDSKTNLAVGQYQDQLRVTIDGHPKTFWIGMIEVQFSPFEVTPP